MFLIVGLGNPENEYGNTRHNVGFDTINEFAKKNKIELKKTKFEALYGEGLIKRRKSYTFKTTNVYEFKWNSCKKV